MTFTDPPTPLKCGKFRTFLFFFLKPSLSKIQKKLQLENETLILLKKFGKVPITKCNDVNEKRQQRSSCY